MKIRIIAKETVSFNQVIVLAKKDYDVYKDKPHILAEMYIDKSNVDYGEGINDCEVEIL